MNRKILALAVCIMTVPVLATAQSVYKWTDENGVTHFGDRQPTGTKSESVSIRTGKPSGSGSTSSTSPQQKVQQLEEQQAENQENQKMTAVEEARQKQRQANCATARSNLDVMSRNARIRVEEDGEQRYLSPEEIEEKREQFKEIAEANCNGDGGE